MEVASPPFVEGFSLPSPGFTYLTMCESAPPSPCWPISMSLRHIPPISTMPSRPPHLVLALSAKSRPLFYTLITTLIQWLAKKSVISMYHCVLLEQKTSLWFGDKTSFDKIGKSFKQLKRWCLIILILICYYYLNSTLFWFVKFTSTNKPMMKHTLCCCWLVDTHRNVFSLNKNITTLLND